MKDIYEGGNLSGGISKKEVEKKTEKGKLKAKIIGILAFLVCLAIVAIVVYFVIKNNAV